MLTFNGVRNFSVKHTLVILSWRNDILVLLVYIINVNFNSEIDEKEII